MIQYIITKMRFVADTFCYFQEQAQIT